MTIGRKEVMAIGAGLLLVLGSAWAIGFVEREPVRQAETGQAVDPLRNRIFIDADGTVSWNGVAVEDAELRVLLERSQAMPVLPELHIRPDPEAPYAAVDRVLTITREASGDKIGLVGNEAYMRGEDPAANASEGNSE